MGRPSVRCPMAVVGVTVRVKDGRPRLKVVVLDDPDASAQPRLFEHYAGGGEDAAEQIHGLADAFHTQLVGVTSSVDAVVVREADDGARGVSPLAVRHVPEVKAPCFTSHAGSPHRWLL